MAFDAVHVLVLTPLLLWVLVFQLGGVTGFFGLHIPSVWTPGDPASYIVPVALLTLPGLAGMARFGRVSMLTALEEDYVRTARAKGLRERTVVYRHVVRNAMLPLSTFVVLSIVGVTTGSIFVETLYGVPGVGQFTFRSITQRDFNVLLGIVLLGATLIVLANLATDILYLFIDPRIRYSRRSL